MYTLMGTSPIVVHPGVSNSISELDLTILDRVVDHEYSNNEEVMKHTL